MSALPPITDIARICWHICFVPSGIRGEPLFCFRRSSPRQHGDAAYSFMFAYAASHSLLFALFAGYAAHSGALQLGTLILVCWFGSFAGDAVRFWIGRRFGTRWLGCLPPLECAVQTAARLAGRHYALMILAPSLPARHSRRRGLCLRNVAAALVHLPGAQFCCRWPVVLHRRLGRLWLRPGLGEAHERRLFGLWLGDAGRVPLPLLDLEQKA
jgi:hypothetical protein